MLATAARPAPGAPRPTRPAPSAPAPYVAGRSAEAPQQALARASLALGLTAGAVPEGRTARRTPANLAPVQRFASHPRIGLEVPAAAVDASTQGAHLPGRPR